MPATVPRITLCIVNYNGAQHLPAALHAAELLPDSFAEILLVDNASTDGSLELVRAQFPGVRILALSHNGGPGAARNAGFNAAACELILFQDNDVRLQPGCAQLLAALLLDRPRALLAAPRVVYERTPQLVQYDSADCHYLGLMAPRHANRPITELEATPGTTTSLVTACFLVDRKRWPGGALFDEDFIFNLEDHDLGVRANLLGLETWVEPRAIVLHGEGTTGLSYRPGNAVATRRMFYLIRNRWWIIGKCFAWRTLLLLAPVLLLYELLQLGGLLCKGWIGEWGLAVRSLSCGVRRLHRKRAAVQATRCVSDRMLLRDGPLPFTSAIRSGRIERCALAIFEWVANGYWKLVRPFI